MFDTKKIVTLAAGTAALLTAFATMASATPIVFNTSQDVGAPTRTRGAGSRGGCNLEEGNVSLNLAAPITTDIGKTVSENPTFFWTIDSDLNVPVEFTLVASGKAEPIFVKTFSADEVKNGMMSVQLPSGHELESNTVYRWTVSAICNASRRSNDVYAQSWIERVEASNLSAGASGVAAAQSYADANLWYDAISALDLDADRLSVMEAYSSPTR
jgi:Domain of Unknown Function (DUF928)